MASLEQLEAALRNANAAGDTAAAQQLAGAIVSMRGGAQDTVPVYDTMGNETAGRVPTPNLLTAADNMVRMGANGLTFGMSDRFAGAMDAATGRAKSYDEGVNAQHARTEAFRQSNPITSAVGEMAGGLVGGAGLIKNGVTLAGRVGSGLLPRVLGYGVEGAAYGGAHGAGDTYSGKPTDYVQNAWEGVKTGAEIGAGIPVVGSLAGAAYRAAAPFVGPRVEGAGRGASALLRGAAIADESGLRAMPRMGQEAMLPDAGPAMLGLAQGAGTGTGPGRSALINALKDRDLGTAQRLAQSLDDNFGKAPIPSRVEAEIGGNLKATGAGYDAPFESAGNVDTREIYKFLGGATTDLRGPAQKVARQVREFLHIPGTKELDPRPESLHQVRQAIDGMLASEENPKITRFLSTARKMVDDELARSVPGVKSVDAQYAELMRQKDALQRGGQILDTGKEAIRPVELVDEIRQGALPQGEQIGASAAPMRLKQGVRADIDRRVGTNINDLNTLEKTFATPRDWNHQKLGTVFGDEARDRVAQDITANRQFRDTYQKVAQGSQTAQRMEAADALKGASGGNIPSDITATSLGLKAINGIAKVLAGKSNATTRDDVGRLLAKKGPDANRLAQALIGSAQSTNANARAIAALLSSPSRIGAYSPLFDRK